MPLLRAASVETQTSPTFIPLSRLMDGSLTRKIEMGKTLQDLRLG